MKSIKKFLTYSLFVFMSVTLSGCFGSFSLVRNLYEFNDSIGGDDVGGRFLKSVVFWVGGIVYSFAGLIDFTILNVIEFWTGANPISMAPGEVETQEVCYEGKTYLLTATQNRMHVQEIVSEGEGEEVALVFKPENRAWYAQSDCQEIKLAEQDRDNAEMAHFYHMDGTAVLKPI